MIYWPTIHHGQIFLAVCLFVFVFTLWTQFIHSFILFPSIFIPVFFVCLRCNHIVLHSRERRERETFKKWKSFFRFAIFLQKKTWWGKKCKESNKRKRKWYLNRWKTLKNKFQIVFSSFGPNQTFVVVCCLLLLLLKFTWNWIRFFMLFRLFACFSFLNAYNSRISLVCVIAKLIKNKNKKIPIIISPK